jgi:serine/threonine protein kinase
MKGAKTLDRVRKYNTVRNLLDGETKYLVVKDSLLGKGEQGTVYKGQIVTNTKKKVDVVIKKIYVDRSESSPAKKDDIYSKKALTIEGFIEISACTLVTELVKQKICPNFVMTYGYNVMERGGICKEEFPYKIFLYNEWIPELKMFSDFCDDKSHDSNEWFNGYFQILAAIYTLQNTLGMSHSDLHSNNILVKKIPKGGHWKYIIDGVEYYVPNLGYQFLLNDFGHAWIKGKMESWYVKKIKKNKNHKFVDPVRIFDEVLEYSVAPKRVREILDLTLDLFETEIEIIDVIYTIFGSFFFLTESAEGSPTKLNDLERSCKKEPFFCYFKKLNSKLIDTFELDATLKRNSIPMKLWKLLK